MFTIRKARIITIAILVLIRLAYKDTRYYYPTQNNINGIEQNNTDIPEESLPKHHISLPLNGTIYFDAIDTQGNRGYIADPTLFRRLVLQWHEQHQNTTYWDRIQYYPSNPIGKNPINNELSMDHICSLTEASGSGNELNDRGIKIITEYVKVDRTPILRKGCTESPPLKHERPKLFCGIYTHGPQRNFTRLSALSYGWKCDGFLAFSTITAPKLGMVGILHKGDENYHNMVQKTRSIWSYIAHYIDQFDYFHLGGDDMHLIVQNMRSLLLEYEEEDSTKEQGRIFGQLASKGSQVLFLRGGGGYTIDRIGLKKLHDYMPKCASDVIRYDEDNVITNCARKLGLHFGDNRDGCTGQQRSHSVSPGILANAKGVSNSAFDEQLRFWAGLSHPESKDTAVKVGLQIGYDAASNHSVTFHELRYPVWLVRHHALLYRACPSTSALGRMYSSDELRSGA